MPVGARGGSRAAALLFRAKWTALAGLAASRSENPCTWLRPVNRLAEPVPGGCQPPGPARTRRWRCSSKPSQSPQTTRGRPDSDQPPGSRPGRIWRCRSRRPLAELGRRRCGQKGGSGCGDHRLSAPWVRGHQGGGPIPDPKATARAQQSGGVDPARSRPERQACGAGCFRFCQLRAGDRAKAPLTRCCVTQVLCVCELELPTRARWSSCSEHRRALLGQSSSLTIRVNS
jgi:hypothetical protein